MIFVVTPSTKSEQKPIIIIKMKIPNSTMYNNVYKTWKTSLLLLIFLQYHSVRWNRRRKTRNKSDVIHNNNDTSIFFVVGSETKSIYNILNYNSGPQNQNWGFEIKLTFGMFTLIWLRRRHNTAHNIRHRGLVLKLKDGNYKLQAQSPMMRMWWVTY